MAVGYYSTTVTTDASGDGTATWETKFNGKLVGLRVEFGATPESTTDTTITEPSGLQRTIQTWTNQSSDVTAHPAALIAGATDAYLPYYVDSANLLVTVDEGGDTKTVTVIALVEDS